MKLLTETNTQKVERKVMRLAVTKLQRAHIHHHLNCAFEHGQWWVLCRDCGASWSVVDSSPGIEGLDLEHIDEGDGYCEANA